MNKLTCHWCQKPIENQMAVEVVDGKKLLFHMKCYSGWSYQGKPEKREE